MLQLELIAEVRVSQECDHNRLYYLKYFKYLTPYYIIMRVGGSTEKGTDDVIGPARKETNSNAAAFHSVADGRA